MIKPKLILKTLLIFAITVISFSSFSESKIKTFDFTKVKKSIGQPYNISNLNSEFTSWGISPYKKSSIHLSGAWEIFKKKSNIIVAVIDTGINANHPFIKNNIYVINGTVDKYNYGVDFSTYAKNINMPNDSHGHGTHVAGIIKSVFPEVRLLALKYYNSKASGQANLNSTIKALEYAVDHNVDIINYSGGGPEPSMDELRILKKAEQKGILIIAAAGNEESNIDKKGNAYYPASYGLSNIITVTAHNSSIKLLKSSNYGRKNVDVSAPGHRIKSASKGTSRAEYLTGTSQATAFVSGIAALIKSNFPNLNFTEIKTIIGTTVDKYSSLKTKCVSGGIVNAKKALQFAKKLSFQKSTVRSIANKKIKPGKIIYRYAQ